MGGKPASVLKYLDLQPGSILSRHDDNFVSPELCGALICFVTGGDEWKEVAERLGFNQAYIRCFDSRYRNPLEVVLTCCHTSVGELYDILVECGLPLPADLL